MWDAARLIIFRVGTPGVTGKWFARDHHDISVAGIVSEFDCAGSRGFARVRAGSRGFARVCAGLRTFARVRAVSPGFALVCAGLMMMMIIIFMIIMIIMMMSQ